MKDVLPLYFKRQVDGTVALYPSAGGTFSVNEETISHQLADADVWLHGAQLMLELPDFLTHAILKGYLVAPSTTAAGAVNPDATAPVSSGDVLLMTGVGIARSGNSESLGGRVAVETFAPPRPIRWRKGEAVRVVCDFKGSILAGNVPAPNETNAFARLVLFTEPITAEQG